MLVIPTPQRIANHLCTQLLEADERQHNALFGLLNQLPVVSIEIPGALTGLSALQAMPLRQLCIGPGTVNSLAPLHEKQLEVLTCTGNRIADLSPLRGMPLSRLEVTFNRIADLSPLKGMPLRELQIGDNAVTDLAPITGMPLRFLGCPSHTDHRSGPLHQYDTQTVEIVCDPLVNLTPLAGVPLNALMCQQYEVADLLRYMQPISSWLHCAGCRYGAGAVALSTAGSVFCAGDPVNELSPLKHIVTLTTLSIGSIPLTADTVGSFAHYRSAICIATSTPPDWRPSSPTMPRCNPSTAVR